MPFLLGRRRQQALESIRRRAVASAPTYPEVGATAGGHLPPGYRHDRVAVVLGEGAEVWERACQALREWQPHRAAGMTVTPPEAPLERGTTVVTTIRLGPLLAVAPCRLVDVVDDAGRFGFSYGTLPGHPEQGEEAFVVTLDRAGTVRFEIVAFSRPRLLLARLGGPLARAVQRRATRRYVEGVRRAVAGAG